MTRKSVFSKVTVFLRLSALPREYKYGEVIYAEVVSISYNGTLSEKDSMKECTK